MAERGTWTHEASGGVPETALPPLADSAAATRDRPGLVAYFGPDLDDPAVRRRVSQWRHAGFKVLPFAFARRSEAMRSEPGEFVNLGHIMPRSRIRRVIPLALAALRILSQRGTLSEAGLFVGRNLDNALLALFARWISGSSAPFIYEIFDVNQSCTEPGPRGALLRRVEKWLLAKIDLLVVSSPYFVTAYYQRILGYRRRWFLFENKVPRCVHLRQLARPGDDALREPVAARRPLGRPWRIGWFGYLDDERSWEILKRLAEKLPHDVAIHVRGIPYTNFDMSRFLADVARLDNVTYGGPYRNPEDLAEVYGAVDIVWSADCNVPNANSKWLLTNGLYEAGYFGKPVIGLVDTAVGQFLKNHGTGWCLEAPFDESLVALIRSLTAEQYEGKNMEAEHRAERFVETDEIERIWKILGDRGAHRSTRGAPVTALPKAAPARAVAEGGRRKVLFMGLFPPPVDGQRIVTQYVFERFDAIALVAPYDVDQFPLLRSFSKPFSAVAACFVILGARLAGYSTLYLAPHSGVGLLCSCLIALVGRAVGCSLALHYHSYWNIGRHSRLMAAFLAICGPGAIHIVLAPPMARDLKRYYRSVRRVAVVSNTAFIEPRHLTRNFGGRRPRIGHLSNLTREKGIGVVLDTMRALRARGIEVDLWLAGPAEDRETGRLIEEAQKELGERLNYLGRLDTEDVRRFYQDIDVFLFPTFHKHEAEPLVVIDALASGVPVIATDRGCISYLLGTTGGYVFAAADFVERAVEQIGLWAGDPEGLAEASRHASARFIEMHEESQIYLERLLATFLDHRRALPPSADPEMRATSNS